MQNQSTESRLIEAKKSHSSSHDNEVTGAGTGAGAQKFPKLIDLFTYAGLVHTAIKPDVLLNALYWVKRVHNALDPTDLKLSESDAIAKAARRSEIDLLLILKPVCELEWVKRHSLVNIKKSYAAVAVLMLYLIRCFVCGLWFVVCGLWFVVDFGLQSDPTELLKKAARPPAPVRPPRPSRSAQTIMDTKLQIQDAHTPQQSQAQPTVWSAGGSGGTGGNRLVGGSNDPQLLVQHTLFAPLLPMEQRASCSHVTVRVVEPLVNELAGITYNAVVNQYFSDDQAGMNSRTGTGILCMLYLPLYRYR